MIDLRSDTVTQPSNAMRDAMSRAPVGDDVFGEDPTVNQLQELAAALSGHQAALFVPTGTQSNLVGLLAHCERGDEYICGQQAHTYKYEGGGAAVLGSIQPQPIEFEADGSLDLKRVEASIKADDFHFARTRLLALENTHAGKVLPLDYLQSAREFCDQKGLAYHLDGARVCNAAVKLGVSLDTITSPFDSVSICLSKGLGAPVGSVLCGSHELIGNARRWRKVVGGGMRQAGVLAAAGIYALQNNVQRLAEDHHNAMELAQGLADIAELRVETGRVQTNMLYVEMAPEQFEPLKVFMGERGIRLDSRLPMRMVTHLDISSEDVIRVVAAFKQFFASRQG
ncbi:low-specificity L-threonine aldolase [Aestuariirhabdus sp. Z084]|uniref:low-specificity L-threonine aldolase n=1 Tax=Aestuariirhabdus haliotis TaxID=2918751 RepID=UPI00201B4069|nr:low-specificity L-threonine aldolase [Aestuariirhabdus haliotis]MCL6415181.1 low-specificity L-threonine aldolase [Aestuariirhabdus haliotis]MCL6420056.1 low-specificity L-threonine aldolase [Aestuariirhabdus haliotis]